ncbi:MAG: branched-chain amino acid ABC transporter permease, partial [Chloroflexota bacterium]
MADLIVQSLTGLAFGLVLFLVASGLSLIFGVMRIVNFAHGALYMFGAYLAFEVTTRLASTPGKFFLAMLIAPLAVALLGLAIEVLLLRRIYRREPLDQLLLTFALVFIAADVARILWGADFKSVKPPGFVDGSVVVLGRSFPQYYFLVWVIAALVAVGLWAFLYQTRAGLICRAMVQDRAMTGALGVNTARVYTAMFVLGAWLAGLGGVL